MNADEGRMYLRLKLSGTTCESLLKHHVRHPLAEVRGHACWAACSREECADDFIHVAKIRKMRGEKEEEGWVQNLEKVLPMSPEIDELEQLRRNAGENARGAAEKKAKEKDKDQSRQQIKGEEGTIRKRGQGEKEEEAKGQFQPSVRATGSDSMGPRQKGPA